MRLSLSVNGNRRIIAAVNGPGYLSAHVGLRDRPKDNDYSKTVRISGLRTLETETVSLDWPDLDLQTGDVLEFRLLDDGEADEPAVVRRSSESPSNLFVNVELAQELLKVVADYEKRLMELVNKSEKTETAEEHKKFTQAVGAVLYEHGRQMLYPIYRRHRELIPDDLKGELL